jgi:hypothetical protein
LKPFLLLFAFVAVLISAGCGGGGGGSTTSSGSTITIAGTVIDVTAGVPKTAVQVQVGTSSVTTLTSTVDGTFTLTAPSGTTELRVNGALLFAFSFSPITSDTNVGDLWIGPTKISVTGRAVDSNTLQPISGVTATLGGISTVSASNGTFTFSGVAYSASGLFPNMPGTLSATNYIGANFNPGSNALSGGVVSVGDIGLVPSSSTTPPGSPYNLWGRVSPLASSPGATVTLSVSGTAYQSTTVASDGTYHFWVPAGTYTIAVTQTGFTAAPVTATLATTNEVLEEDVTLSTSP